MNYKTPAGRLREAGVLEIRRLRDEKRADGKPVHSYQAIATNMGVSIGTVYNVCSGKTHDWLK